MFKIESDAERQRTIERIAEVKARIEKMRATHGPEAAELYAKANRHHVAELEEQIRMYDEEKRRVRKGAEGHG